MIIRRPWRLPLSSGIGATPTNAPICLRLSVPSSGTFASTIAQNALPKPGTLRTICSCAATRLRTAHGLVDVLFAIFDASLQVHDVMAQFCAS